MNTLDTATTEWVYGSGFLEINSREKFVYEFSFICVCVLSKFSSVIYTVHLVYVYKISIYTMFELVI